jgi:hypothetical protein
LSHRRSYIGFSTNVNNVSKNKQTCRYRTHALKLKAGAKYTKTFDSCILHAKIEGFPTKKLSLSYEWFSKTGIRLKIRRGALKLKNSPHYRLDNLFAPLLYEKFKDIKNQLIVYVNDPDNVWSKDISEFYGVEVRQLEPPFHPSHLKPKRKINNKKRFAPY